MAARAVDHAYFFLAEWRLASAAVRCSHTPGGPTGTSFSMLRRFLLLRVTRSTVRSGARKRVLVSVGARLALPL